MNKLNTAVQNLLAQQLESWNLAQKNFADLKNVQTKSFDFGSFEVKVQFNPARMVSSGAKVDDKSIANRKCFLCASNRPSEQKAIVFGNYEILVNPFPIFPEHFTIPRKEHVPQQIKPYFSDMLNIAKSLDNYLIFYNGPKCGASAPDHMHFQAGTKNFLPLVNDYFQHKETLCNLLVTTDKSQLYQFNNYLRTAYCIESNDIESAKDAFDKLYNHFQNKENEEPMMNIICSYANEKWFTFILPRKNFRPWQFSADVDRQLLISPATVEMSGIIITPVESHFNKITKKDIESIFEQTSV